MQIGDIRTINRAEDTPMCVDVLMLPIFLGYQYAGRFGSSE